MNTEKILMCWNIPKIDEELLYELFCIAGPIENISFSTSGKSCFIIYEHEEAVRTAKDIFQDTKLYSRMINMYDAKDIEEIYKQQELIENRKRRFEAEDQDISYKRRSNFEQARSFNDRFLQDPHCAMNSSPSFNRNNAQSYPDYRDRRDNRLINQFHSHNYENNHSNRSDTPHSSHSKSGDIDIDPPPGVSAEEFRAIYQHSSFASRNPLNSPAKNSYQMRRDLQPSSNKKMEWNNSPNFKNAGENSVTNDYEDFLRQTSNPYTTPPSINCYQQRYSSADLPPRLAQEQVDKSNHIGKADVKIKNHHIRLEDLTSSACDNPYDKPVSRNNFNRGTDGNEQYGITDDLRNRLNKNESDMKGKHKFQERRDIRFTQHPRKSYDSFKNKSNRREHDRSHQSHHFEYNRSHNSDKKFRNNPITSAAYVAQDSFRHQKDYSSRGYSPRSRRY